MTTGTKTDSLLCLLEMVTSSFAIDLIADEERVGARDVSRVWPDGCYHSRVAQDASASANAEERDAATEESC